MTDHTGSPSGLAPAADAAQLASDVSELRETLRYLGARRRLLLVAPVVAAVLGLGVSFLMKPVFTSNTLFMPPQQQQSGAASALASLGALAGLAGGGIKSPADQYVSLMQSDAVTDRLVDRYDLRKVYNVKFRFEAKLALSKHTVITIGKKDGLISVAVDDHDPKRAAAIANDYVAELRRVTATLAVSEAQQRRAFFSKLLADTRDRLTAAQVALQGSGITEGTLKAEPRTAAETYATLRAQLTAAEVRLETLQGSLANGAPEVRQQQAAVQALRARVAEAEKTDAASTGGPDYISKYREFKYQETLFDLMAKQYELARVDESREGGLIQVIDAAEPAEWKSRPHRALIAVMSGLLTAVLLPLFLIVRLRWRRFMHGDAPGAAIVA